MENVQDVRFSGVATWMSRWNDSNFLKRAGNTNELGTFSFGYFSFGKHDCMDAGAIAERKTTRQQAKKARAGSPLREDDDASGE